VRTGAVCDGIRCREGGSGRRVGTSRSPGSLVGSLGGSSVLGKALEEGGRLAKASFEAGARIVVWTEPKQDAAARDAPGSGLQRLLPAVCGHDKLTLTEIARDPRYHDPRLSRVLLNALLVLAPFASEPEQRVMVLADELGMPAGTAVRLLKTWAAVGVLRQDGSHRPYRSVVPLLSGRGY
jgi:hypothetical protein